MSRQAYRRKMLPDALGISPRRKPMPDREVERTAHAEGDRLPVQQPIREAGSGLEGVPEGVTEIEQRPLAGLALIARDRQRLCAAAHRDRVLSGGPARENLAPIGVEPGEEGGIADQ